MAILLGIDTGGTYTDAVLFDGAADRVLRTAKALTTPHDLSVGVRAAMRAVLDPSDERGDDRAADRDGIAGETGVPLGPADIAMVSVSTTLATNAVVENQGSPAGLMVIGQGPEILGRAGLREALDRDPVAFIEGGHSSAGDELCPLDEKAVMETIGTMNPKVAAFAVSSYFAVRNPRHELRVAELVRAATGKPVSCAHTLSAGLDAPRRALTALLNARLIPLLDDLIRAVRGLMDELGIAGPLMVVQGDGALISAQAALERPVETILSGPAASAVGAQHLAKLTGAEVSESGAIDADMMIADIGGTTTDVARILDGRPMLSPEGASVGGRRTMVRAIEVLTVGLGGDSEVRLSDDPTVPGLALGPRRAVPLSLLASQDPRVMDLLDRDLARDRGRETDGRIVLLRRDPDRVGGGLTRMERELMELLRDGPIALKRVLDLGHLERVLQRLRDRGVLQVAAFTPTDAAHVLDRQATFSRDAALRGAELWARREDSRGRRIAPDGGALARMVIETLVRETALFLADCALSLDGRPLPPGDRTARALLRHAFAARDEPLLADPALATAASDREASNETDAGPVAARPRAVRGRDPASVAADPMFDIRPRLTRPLVAIGAPAETYYPEIGRRLGTCPVVPRHAEVCNAIGAVAGRVVRSISITISSPSEGVFRVHGEDGTRDYPALESAAGAAEREAAARAEQAALAAGADRPVLRTDRYDKIVNRGGPDETFVESLVVVTASGQPRLASVQGQG